MIDYISEVISRAEVETEPPIFRDTGQALYIAYLFCSLPASAKSPSRVAMEEMAAGNIEEISLRGIKFGQEMSPLDIRGQCAQIIGIVERELSGLHLDAVRAKYGHESEKLEAMVKVRDHVRGIVPEIAQKAVTRIVAYIYGSSVTRGMLSNYAIAGAVGGISHESVRAAKKIIKREIYGMEREALAKLSPIFVTAGISAN